MQLRNFFDKTIKDPEDNPDDQKQYQKAEHLQVTHFLKHNADTLFKLTKQINPKSKYYKSYLLLDTDNKYPELSSTTKWVWKIHYSNSN